MCYSSAPSLVSPIPTESSTVHSIPSMHTQPPRQLAPLTTLSSGGSSASSIGSASGGTVPTQLSKKEQAKHSSLESKPKKLVMLQDPPSLQENPKLGKMKNSLLDNHHKPLHPLEHTPQSIGQKKHSLLVQ